MNKQCQSLHKWQCCLLFAGLSGLLGGCVSESPVGTPQSRTAEQSPRSDGMSLLAKTPPTYQAIFIELPPVIDGLLNDASWSLVPWTSLFVDIEGDKKPKPTLETRVKMAWDDTYFYIGARLEEPHVWGSLTARDSIIYNDNDFEVFIDPESDATDYFEYEVNALNTPFDLTLTKPYVEGGTFNIDWDIIGLKTAVGVEGTINDPSDKDQAWKVEIAIPWSSLTGGKRAAVAPHLDEIWRINFSRVQWQHRIVNGAYQRIPDTPEHNWVWVPTGVIDMHRPRRWGFVQFVR